MIIPLYHPSPKRYCLIYDNGDRQGLLNAYHAEACFSLTVLFSSTDSSSHSQLKLLPRALHPALQQSQAMSWNHFTGWTTTAVSSFTPGNSLCEYFKYSRNMKVLKHPCKCVVGKMAQDEWGRRAPSQMPEAKVPDVALPVSATLS